MGKSHGWTSKEQVQQIIAFYREGKTTKEIVALTGLTESTVGAYNPTFTGDPVRAGRIEALLAQGLSQAEIRAATGEQQEYVSRIGRRWAALREADAGKAEEPAAAPVILPIPVNGDDLAAAVGRLQVEKPDLAGFLVAEIVEVIPKAPHQGEAGYRAQIDDARVLMRDDSRFQRLPGGLWRLAADDAPLTEREESNKHKLLRLIVTSGTFESEGALTRRVNQTPDIRLAGHEIAHVLHALRKQGKVTFHHSPTGPNGSKITRIAATANGKAYVRSNRPRIPEKTEPDNGPYVGAAHEGFLAETRLTGKGSSFRRKPRWTEEQHVAAEAPVEAVAEALAASQVPDERLQEWAEQLAPSAPPVPAEPVYPHLADLRKRVADGETAKARAEAYLAAAALLEPYDAEKPMVDALVASANDLGEKYRLDPVEAEYLAYAEAHPNGRE